MRIIIVQIVNSTFMMEVLEAAGAGGNSVELVASGTLSDGHLLL